MNARRVRVKICGITRPEDAWAAIEAGADALGFIVYPKSPRFLDVESAAHWIGRLPPLVSRVLVTVNDSTERLRRLVGLGVFQAIQFHGDETPEQIGAIEGANRIRAFRLGASLPSAASLESWGADAFLLDAADPINAPALYGGSGKTCDWGLASDFCRLARCPTILAGGLNPDNVSEAIRAVRPYAIDVNSGVESAPGLKDAAKIRALFDVLAK